MPRFRYAIADVFTAQPLQGNQLAVFTDARGIGEHLLQPLAKEMGFSETVFVYPPTTPEAHVKIRIFTPRAEILFAGHPVLGTAFVLGVALQAIEVRLETGKGIVPVVLERDGARVIFGWMRQPVPTVELLPETEQAELLAALGVARSELPIEVYDSGIRHVFVVLGSEAEVAALQPDLGRLGALGAMGVNCFAGSGTRWKTRMWAPGLGIAEDPASGSAAGPLALHLCRHGRLPFGQEIVITQGVEMGRTSQLHARAEGAAEAVEAIQVGGAAVIVSRGEFLL